MRSLTIGPEGGIIAAMRVAQVSQAILPSAARTASPGASGVVYEQNGDDYVGVSLLIDASAVTSTPSLTVSIEAYDEASGTWFQLLAGAAIATISKAILQVGPDVPTAANVSRQMRLPRRWRVVATHGNANSITYSIGAWLEQG